MRRFFRLLPLIVLGCSTAPSPTGPADSGDDVLDAPARDTRRDVTFAPLDQGTDSPHRPDAPDAPPRLGAPYPVVLAHGFIGFESFAGIDMISYFFGVKDHMAEQGETVFTPAVDPFNNSEVRGAELLERIEAILAETGHAKVNIIAHSQGGLDARFVAHMRPDLVHSIVTVATPHRGTPLLDFVLGAAGDSALAHFLDDLVQLIGGPLYDAIGEETSFFESMRQLSESGAAEFNERHPDSPGVHYYSIGGRSGNALGRRACRPDGLAPDFISRWNRTVDPIDPLFALSEALFDGTILNPEPNDGLVRVSSSRWGIFLGCIPADHMDEVGHLFGDQPGLLNRWDHLDFYADVIAWMRAQGY